MNKVDSKYSSRRPELRDSGLTFIELLIYVGILALMMGSLLPTTWEALNNRAKVNTNSEIYSQVRNISERIKYEIRNASGINSVTATSISLSNSLAGNNPTVIDQSGAFIRIKQGTGITENLNSTDSTVSGLVFTNYTSGDNKTKNIQFEFNLSANYNSARQEYKVSSAIRGAVEVRSN